MNKTQTVVKRNNSSKDVTVKTQLKVSGVEERLDKELNLNHHWWMARAMSKYNVNKEVAELILEDMSMVLEDKQEDMNKTIQSEIKANDFKWKKKIRGLKIDTNNDFAISEEYHLGCTDTVKEFNKTINNLIKNE